MAKITEKNYFKNCPKCGKEQGYKHRACRNRAEKNNATCRSCSKSISSKGKKRRPMSTEAKANISAALKGRPVPLETRAKIAETLRGRPIDRDVVAKISATRKVNGQILRDACLELYGEKASVPTDRSLRKWAIAIKERDNYQCQCCGAKDLKSTNIHSHHIVPKEYFADTVLEITNGITLCRSCHRTLHIRLDKLTLEGIKLSPVGFQEHAARFIADGKASSQSGQTPPGYTSVFSASVTIVKE